MASKRKSSDQALENKALKARKIDNQGNLFSEECTIIWKIIQNSHDHMADENFDSEFHLVLAGVTEMEMMISCYLKKDLAFHDYYQIVLKWDEYFCHGIPFDSSEYMVISLSLIDKINRIHNTQKKVIEDVIELDSDMNFPKFIKKDDLFDIFFSNEELTIHCKIHHSKERNKTEIHQLKVLDNFENLFKSGEFSDMKFIIDNKELKVHKNILSVQSPVFQAMFKYDTQEQRSDSVEIIDINYKTMKEVLRFIYSGKVDNVKRMAKDIFVAAEKYEISALKTICENELIASLSIENISVTLKLIDQYDSKNLKKSVLDFISHNAEDIKNTEDFQKTLDTLSNNLLKEMIKQVISNLWG